MSTLLTTVFRSFNMEIHSSSPSLSQCIRHNRPIFVYTRASRAKKYIKLKETVTFSKCSKYNRKLLKIEEDIPFFENSKFTDACMAIW